MSLRFQLGQGWDRPFGLSKSLKQREAGETACATERQNQVTLGQAPLARQLNLSDSPISR